MTRAVVPGQFGLSERALGERHVLALTGELDVASAPALEAKVVDLCTNGAETVVLDLSELDFIDSTGLRTILSAKSLCDAKPCAFSLVPGNRSIQRVFVLTGLLEHLPFQENGFQENGFQEDGIQEDDSGAS